MARTWLFQLLLSTRRDAVPITRDFMVDAERGAWSHNRVNAFAGRFERTRGIRSDAFNACYTVR